MIPAWLPATVAGLMLAVAALSAARLAAARPWARGGGAGTDAAHLLMGIAMAGMLTPRLRTLPDAAWEVVFGVLTAWFAVQVTRDARRSGTPALAGGHCVPHLVHSASMLYMVLAMTAAGPAATGTGGMGMAAAPAGTLRYPTLALLFAFLLVGYGIWDLDQLSGRRCAFAPPPVRPAGLAAAGDGARDGHLAAAIGPSLLSTAVTVGCRVAMGVAMAFLLCTAI